jgi:hypothetical protein
MVFFSILYPNISKLNKLSICKSFCIQYIQPFQAITESVPDKSFNNMTFLTGNNDILNIPWGSCRIIFQT